MTLQIRSLEEYRSVYERSVRDPEGFWAEQAAAFRWRRPWQRVLEWNFREPRVKWFVGGRLNITENCLDRHLEVRPDQVALLWEPNDPQRRPRRITYRQLYGLV
jgi:acetyl-CoA synthetase